MPKKSKQATLPEGSKYPETKVVSNKNGRLITMKFMGMRPSWRIIKNEPDPKAAKLGTLSKKEAQKIQRKRPDKERIADAKKTSKKQATDIRWAQDPNKYDYPGVDTKGKGKPRKKKES